ncbi:sodium:proton antiporter [Pseudomonas abyssi]|jgi:Na+/H+ antiporter NhaD/arsenite permease-like protein|uniref:Sodium:proton antiporter n=1 Tax=Pseudomonas abyssi TaxID=170540 RepID=A0A2A3MD78_9PSED|nr:sodium:proton antiporter NhaD [Pseudomonas abyssi]MAC99885.1 sodium:proton antiporter [Pseudomonadales bacterium]PBK02751.1 sodium:proton antiporter [Pseudomonas abyssi]|tara:strand:+ start:23981 stop:25237 length:1257 start_codon:yes stop_codon:yes gene_type:complete
MQSSVQILLLAMAVIAFLGVVLEEVIHVNKAKVVLLFGALSWLVLFIAAPSEAVRGQVHEALNENITDIASLWLFLLATMTFVAYLNKKGLIENIIYRILPGRITERKLLFLTGGFCFVFSSVADNITATLVSVALVLSLNLELRKMLRFATLVVFAVNSGGVAMITGDVTTLMIFMADKVEITNLLLLSAPALLAVLLLAALLSIGMGDEVIIERNELHELRGVDQVIGGLFLFTIIATILLSLFFAIPPVLTFLTGLALMFLIARFFNEDIDNDPILEYIRVIEFETLLFFLGVLLLVGMLQYIGTLQSLTSLYDLMPPMAANFLMGMLSALIDNVPLTAALLKADLQMTIAEWMGLTYAVGVGGSLLIIGSAAGIVAMSKMPGLTFMTYLRSFGLLLMAFAFGFVAVYGLGLLVS